MVAIGVVRHRPGRVVAWSSVALALVVAGVAGVTGPLEVADRALDVARLAFWLLLGCAVLLLSREISPERVEAGWMEVSTVAVAVAIAVWLLVLEPIAGADPGVVGSLAAGVVPVLGGAVTAAATRFALRSGFRRTSSNTLALGLLLHLAGDLVAGHQVVRTAAEPSTTAGAFAIAGSLVIAATATDASMAHVAAATSTPREADVARCAGFAIAVLVPLVALLALALADIGSTATTVAVALAAVASFVALLVRMWQLRESVVELTAHRGHGRLVAMVEHSSDVVALVDEHGDIRYASAGLADTLGHRGADWIGRPLLDLIAEEDRAVALAGFEDLLTMGPKRSVRFESSVVRVDGQRRRMEASFANMIGGDTVDGIVATFRDVTEQRDRERTLSNRAFHDELTGLANRASFLERMDAALRAVRPDADPVIVLFVDLDDFKGVNDTLGHAAGDQLLRAIAGHVRSVAGSGDTPARLGGDEFALLLEEQGGLDRAVDLAERLLDAMREPIELAGVDTSVLASVGVAVAAPGATTTQLLRDADAAMYEAKRAGKGRVEVFDPAMRLGPSTQLEYRTELASAVERDQLRLVFQPIIDLGSGAVVGAEALVRWWHPERGEIPPGEFIPLAERSGLIKEIGRWVMHAAFAEAARWQACGELTVNVNVSVVQLRVAGFVEQVRADLEATGVPPARVLLEINETVLVDQIESGSDVLAGLRALGVGIAIDNFGTSWCSLSCLHRFPVDVVKIDRDVVAETGGLADLILRTTSTLGIRSVAEGLERPEQVAFLRALGCDLGQGRLLSAPLELDVVHERFGVEVATVPVPARVVEPPARPTPASGPAAASPPTPATAPADGRESDADLVGTV
ncbi:putative bifunctional diguanylate cyclase/phosphodiesterase [Ilumatobacter sp.]|uniref:putative bifunctional diguanylate cyclase/phosphodiesterase n=1 Tax=Ilumatobacter sp. TaxID=1967498 RepID=UPI003B52FB66